MLAVPAIECFTLATRVPKGKTCHSLHADPSRLEYQTRTNVVHVQTNRKPFLDDKKRVCDDNLIPSFLSTLTPMKSPRAWMAGCFLVGVHEAPPFCLYALAPGPCSRRRFIWRDLVSPSSVTVFTQIWFLYFLSLDYQYAQSSRRLKEGFELAMAESAKPGMDYNK